jgi:hypothetical protein
MEFRNMKKQRLLALLVAVMVASAISGCGATPTPGTTATTAATTAATSAAASNTAAAGADIDQARAALTDYFAALHGKRYPEAARLYGGSYLELAGYNPRVPPDDHVKLLENGCTANGFQCLEIRKILKEETVSPTEFSFVVEFQNEDGSLFTQKAGPAGQPARSQWTYTVKKVEDVFLVQELPVYLQ